MLKSRSLVSSIVKAFSDIVLMIMEPYVANVALAGFLMFSSLNPMLYPPLNLLLVPLNPFVTCTMFF